jgi:Fe-S-cluster containining protein
MAKRSSPPAPPIRKLPVVANSPREKVGCLTCALCCSYIAVEIDGPDSVKSATEILWHLYHHQVSVYRDNDDDWVVQFETRCRHLLPDNRCAIYENRPHICREYADDSCEVNADDEGTTFYTPQDFLGYLERTSPRIYRLVAKTYRPGPEHLGPIRGVPPRPRESFEARFRRLRGAGPNP